MTVLDQLAQPASSSRQFATFKLTIAAIILVDAAVVACYLAGVPLPTEIVAAILAPILTLGVAATGARAWHDRDVRVAAVAAERENGS